MKKIISALLIFISCSVLSHESESPPELWSWFKDLNKSKPACEVQSSFILQKLNVENQVQNEYGIYGNIKNNRIVVKCIEAGEGNSKLMVAVAGQARDSVEIIRNTIVKEIK